MAALFACVACGGDAENTTPKQPDGPDDRQVDAGGGAGGASAGGSRATSGGTGGRGGDGGAPADGSAPADGGAPDAGTSTDHSAPADGGRGGAGGSPNASGGAPSVNPMTHPTDPYCEGFAPSPDEMTCESDSDCMDGQTCIFQNTVLPCTLGCAGPFDECGPSAPCPNGMVCDGTPASQIGGGCACGGGLHCVSACAADADCPPDYECQTDGRCTPMACTDGFECPVGRVCDVGSDYEDNHGCRLLRCDEPGGFECVENQVCDPGAAPNALGCRTKSCRSGSDCDCGVCSPEILSGQRECVGRPGLCAVVAVPG